MLRNVMLTGATGFVGKHLARELLSKGFNVTGVHRRNFNDVEMSGLEAIGLSWVHVDDLKDAINNSKFDCIAHLATSYDRNCNSEEIRESNLTFPIRLLNDFIKSHGKLFINADSYYCKGDKNYQAMPYYSKSKNAFKKAGEAMTSESSCRFLTVRLEHVYGPGDREDKFIPFLLQSFRRNVAKIELTDCRQMRDFIFINDVCAAITQLIINIDYLPLDYKEVEVGTGEKVSLKYFVECLAEQTGTTTQRLYGMIDTRQGEISSSASNLEWVKYIGWKATKNMQSGINVLLKSENL